MRQTCEAYLLGSGDEFIFFDPDDLHGDYGSLQQCGKPAVDCYGALHIRVWLCAEHFDEMMDMDIPDPDEV